MSEPPPPPPPAPPAPPAPPTPPDAAAAQADDGITLSARTGAGLDTLRQALLARAGWQAATEGVFIARKRHRLALPLILMR
jgi:tRNA U34 5-carboxymethylaminomethyl modifying GTPase MnmE/TrmE